MGGNATIHVTPPNKIRCIKKDQHEKLVNLVKKYWSWLRPAATTQKSARQRDYVKHQEGNCPHRNYEASNIWATRDSDYWRWRRMKKWFKEYVEEREGRNYQKELKILGVK